MRDQIFISYSHEDSEWADRFERMLNAHGDDQLVFRDSEKIAEGEDWESRLRMAVSRARVALVLVTPKLLTSEYVTKKELPWLLRSRDQGLRVTWVEVEPSLVPPDVEAELHRLQAFKLKTGSGDDRCLCQLPPGDQEAEIKRICESLIASMAHDSPAPRLEFFNRVSDVVHRRFGYSTWREIAIGDHSVVYSADAPGSRVVIKAQVKELLESEPDERIDEVAELDRELIRAKSLEHHAFVKVLAWSFDTDPHLIVTEFVPGPQTLRGLLRAEGARPVHEVRFIIQTIAAALDEYHHKELVYSNIRPSDVLVTTSAEGERLPWISAYRMSQASLRWEKNSGDFRVNSERLTYLAPEQYRGRAVATEKTDQYSLGLLAVEMLQGEPPVRVEHLVDLERKTSFFEDPRAFGGAWLERSPSLTRVVLRMLDPDPAERWESMGRIAGELGGQATAAENNRWLAKQSYRRLMTRRDEFLESFYGTLLRQRPDLAAKFPKSTEDARWKRQYAMLGRAIRDLLNFSAVHAAAEPTILSDTAASHRAHGLSPADFDAFQAAFIDTLSEFDEADEEMKAAWQSCFEPGIAYMKRAGTGHPPASSE